jgi:hypothetical protein
MQDARNFKYDPVGVGTPAPISPLLTPVVANHRGWDRGNGKHRLPPPGRSLHSSFTARRIPVPVLTSPRLLARSCAIAPHPSVSRLGN